MTIEEKAIEYANKLIGKFIMLNSSDRKIIKDAYMAGAKEMVWHDLRKDPDDLPPMHKRCVFIHSLIYSVGAYSHYENADYELNGEPCWYDENDDKEIDCETVVAWCEIGSFKHD